MKFPPNQERNPKEDEMIVFKDPPEKFECWPYFDGMRGRNPAVDFAYMEPVASINA